MPIECSKIVKRKNQETFYDIDFKVMGSAFDIHNRLGRFLDESIYNMSLANACIDAGIKADSEVAIKVSYKDFHKVYFFDILVENGIIYELKTCRELNSIHKQQLLNYLMLANINYGKLINFHPENVEYEFVSTNLTYKSRHDYCFDTRNWDLQNKQYKLFETILKELFADWGGFLDLNLYKEAMIHFLGGKDAVISPVDIIDNGKIVGRQKIPLLNKTTAFHFATVKKNFDIYCKHIKRLLKHSYLETILVINIDKEKITLTTVK